MLKKTDVIFFFWKCVVFLESHIQHVHTHTTILYKSQQSLIRLITFITFFMLFWFVDVELDSLIFLYLVSRKCCGGGLLKEKLRKKVLDSWVDIIHIDNLFWHLVCDAGRLNACVSVFESKRKPCADKSRIFFCDLN